MGYLLDFLLGSLLCACVWRYAHACASPVPPPSHDDNVLSAVGPDLADPLERDEGVLLQVSDAAIDLIVQEAYDPAYGARPIRRYLQRQVATEVARKLMEQDALSQGDAISVDASNGVLSYAITKNKRADHDTEMQP
jgi:hypothetical protein